VSDTQTLKILAAAIPQPSKTKIAQASKTSGIKTNVIRVRYQAAGGLDKKRKSK
jgi:hypothetical protein